MSDNSPGSVFGSIIAAGTIAWIIGFFAMGIALGAAALVIAGIVVVVLVGGLIGGVFAAAFRDPGRLLYLALPVGLAIAFGTFMLAVGEEPVKNWMLAHESNPLMPIYILLSVMIVGPFCFTIPLLIGLWSDDLEGGVLTLYVCSTVFLVPFLGYFWAALIGLHFLGWTEFSSG